MNDPVNDPSSLRDRGMAVRRAVLGDAHVAAATAAATSFDADFQKHITETVWGAVWARPDLDRRTRHLVTIAMLAALGREHELALHLRSVGRTGVTTAELREVFFHVAAYAGVPAANSAFALAKRLLAEQTPASPHPLLLNPGYASTVRRAPHAPLVALPRTLAEATGPVFGDGDVRPHDCDLTANAVRDAAPLGERMLVTGRVLDDRGHPVRGALVELWQANSAGRYTHKRDQHDAPLDPNFSGTGRALTDAEGRYRFTTIRPGAYPWSNHENAWRPAHLHFSVLGAEFTSRLVTQMYFPGDPLLALDPIYQSVPDPDGRARLVAVYDHTITQPLHALGYRFDIVVCGPRATPFEEPHA